MPSNRIGGHYSQAYDDELKRAVDGLQQMAHLTQQQLTDAVQAFVNADTTLAQKVVDTDHSVNDLEVDIDEHCLDILARRQPAATDLRLVLAILKSINDVERIGDQAKRIAKTLLLESDDQRPQQSQLDDINTMAERVVLMLQHALQAFDERDASQALAVLREDKAIDEDYGRILRHSLTGMREDARRIGSCLQVSSVARALERVGDHSRNICQHAIFLSKGRNAAHLNDDELQQLVENPRR